MVSDEVIEVLQDIRRWLKIIGLQEAKPLLTDALSSEDEEEQKELRIIYHLTDGEHSTRDIASRISYSRFYISSRYSEWSNMGLIERDSPNSSYHHIVSLEEAGIEVPDIPDPEDSSEGDDEESDSEEVNEEQEDEGEETEAAAQLSNW